MASVKTWLIVSFLSFAAVGCVSQEKATALRMEAEQYAAQLSVVEREKAEAIAGRDLLQRQLEKYGLGDNQKDALILSQTTEINQLQHELADVNRRLAKAMSEVGTTVVLAPEVNKALQEFAAQNPDLVEYDQSRGMLKFKSDVTFTPGSAMLTPTASSAIDRFATILNSPAAAGYELMVVGHTDNVAVSHEATRKMGHFDNWYLSAHRAIAVSSELQKQRVSSARLEVAGCADQRPIAANTSEAGKAMNRRVEVMILPTTTGHAAVAVAPSAPIAVKASAKVKKPTILNKDENKDAIVPDAKHSALNK